MTPHRILTVLTLVLAAARAPAARAADEAPSVETPGEAGGETTSAPSKDVILDTPEPATPPATAPPERSFLETYYPPPVDGPELRLPESPTRLYLDGAYAASGDLSALQLIEGSATNVRFALGGALRWHRMAFEAEVPFVQITKVNVTAVSGGQPPIPSDAHQTGISFGDVRVGATWTTHLVDDALVAGFGLRLKLPTHTTNFTFHVMQGTPGNYTSVPLTYAFPYYLHIEPTVILGGALGRFTYVVNEGLDILWGPNGQIDGQEVVVPTIVFWDSHVALSFAPLDFLGASVEVGTDVQINNTNDPMFPIADIRSVWVAPAIQVHLGDYRVDLIARLGIPSLAHGTDAFGVLYFVGTDSYTLRIGRTFN
ncbi:MAG TPA: hypothetical protein VKZ18_07235 [Polyangia bacterium]|nr:hypothetical protein [Polyangia bacterium]